MVSRLTRLLPPPRTAVQPQPWEETWATYGTTMPRDFQDFVGGGGAPSAPAPVSHVDTATRACLLTATDAGTDTDTTGTLAALGQVARASSGHLIVQSYRTPTGVKPAAYVNSLVQLGCSTVVTAATGPVRRWPPA
ncbi:hypothetical protein ACWDFR_22940 [Streptomyces sp. 900105755]